MNDTKPPPATPIGNLNQDIVEMIVNAHTNIEHMLESILREYFPSPEFYDDARLTFYQKLNLVRAKHWRHQDHAIWQLIKQMNGLRNEVSRHPTPEVINQAIEGLFDFYLEIEGFNAKAKTAKPPASQQLSRINQLIEVFLKEHVSDSAFLNGMSRNLIKAFNKDQQKSTLSRVG